MGFANAVVRQIFMGKFVKWGRCLAGFWEHIFYNVEWVEVRKMGEVF